MLNEYSLSNVLLLVFQILLPLIIYIVSFTYVSDEQSAWYESLKFKTGQNILSGNKGMFVGCVVYIFTGVASLLIINAQQKKIINEDALMPKSKLQNFLDKEKESNIHLFLFPIMILLSNIGFVVAYQIHNFLTHIILSAFSGVICLYLMFHYYRTISRNISFLLLPLLLWQFFNVVYYGIGIVEEK